jgi:hypothetical protein
MDQISLQTTKILFLFHSVEVLATLTSDVGRILSKLHQVQPQGNINLLTGIRIAHVSWKQLYAVIVMIMNILVL